jgi:hypothetical protein
MGITESENLKEKFDTLKEVYDHLVLQTLKFQQKAVIYEEALKKIASFTTDFEILEVLRDVRII